MIENSSFVIFNDHLIKREQAVVPIDQRAVRFADGLFETMRAFALEIPLLSLHYRRLIKGMTLLGMETHNFPSEKQLADNIARLIKSNKHFNGARVRLSVYRKGDGLYTPETNSVDYYIETFSLSSNEFQLNTKGKTIDVYTEMVKPVHPLFSFKSSQSQLYILASLWAKQQSLDDAVLMNPNGNLVEATSSNFFMVMENKLYTPPLSDGCMEGVMRKAMIDTYIPALGMAFSEQSLTPDMLLSADEIFLTDAVHGVQWVLAYKNRRFFNKISKAIIELLNRKINN
jgi:branched-chain amino acid aminotransferase